MPNLQFPVEAYDNFVKQSVPRWTTTDEAIIRAYTALVDRVCPCVILFHSQAGQFGFKVAQARPRSEEHTSELQSLTNLVCRLLLTLPSRDPPSLHDALPIYAEPAVPSRGLRQFREAERAALDDHRRGDHPRVYRAGGPRVPVRDSLSLAGGAVRLQGGAGAAQIGRAHV